ncbi:MAG: type I-E CRISPR-associated protein Cas7/Cse4/CasC, partial [bacterium]
ITANQVTIEDDFFTAVDDLNTHEEDAGAGHMGDAGFSAGVFYQYICIDRDRLVENLQGDEDLAESSIAALVEAAAKVAPTGKQNSFASRAYTSYLLAEKGSQQPRSLSVAFLQAVRGGDLLGTAIERLGQQRDNFDKVYGPCADERRELNALTGEGNLQEIIGFVKA